MSPPGERSAEANQWAPSFVAGRRRPVDVEVRNEPVLIAAVADELDPAVPLDEARQPGLHVVAAAAFAVDGANLRREHLVERRSLQDRVVAVDQKGQVFCQPVFGVSNGGVAFVEFTFFCAWAAGTSERENPAARVAGPLAIIFCHSATSNLSAFKAN